MKRLLLLLLLLPACSRADNAPAPPVANAVQGGGQPDKPAPPAPGAAPARLAPADSDRTPVTLLPLCFVARTADAEATAAAVQWLAGCQGADGLLAPAGEGEAAAIGLRRTAMGLLALLGSGMGRRDEAGALSPLTTAAMALRRGQHLSGAFGDPDDPESVLTTALAGFVQAQAQVAATRNYLLRSSNSHACTWLLQARAPGSGWGAHPSAQPDLWHTSWAMLALASFDDLDTGRSKASAAAIRDGAAFVATLADGPTTRFRADGWAPWETGAPLADALWMLCCLLNGTPPNAQGVAIRAARLCQPQNLPGGEAGAADAWYGWFGTLVLSWFGGKPWASWRTALRDDLLRRQQPAGSWAAEGAWAVLGGPVEATALALLALRCARRPDAKAEAKRYELGLWHDAVTPRYNTPGDATADESDE